MMKANKRDNWARAQIQILAWGLLAFSCADSDFKADSARIQSADAIGQEGPSTPLTPTESTLPAAISRKPDALTASFAASQIKDESLKITLDPKGVSSGFTLKDINKDLSDDRTQISRTPLTYTSKQGTPGTAVNDMFDQTAKKGLLDLLVVIDNSGSMSQEQANLGARLSNLLSSVSNSDWQIGVITTSYVTEPAGACRLSLIKSTEANAASKFAVAINVGINGDSNEQGIRQARIGLECKETPWLRANSSVAVLIVSDEDNCSNGAGCGTSPWAFNNHLTDYVKNTLGRTVGKNAGYYGIFSPPGATCAAAPTPAPLYLALTQFEAPNSMNFGNICDASFSTTLNRISSNISNLLGRQFELSSLPATTPVVRIQAKNGSIRTAVSGTDYTLQGKTLSFITGREPPMDSKILVDYRVGVTPLVNFVTLPSPPAPETVAVKVNNVALNANDYTLAGSRITFAVQPAPLAEIMVDYRLNTPLTSQFVLSKTPLANTLAVTVDGAPTSAYTFDAAKNEVIFSKAPLDGAKIRFLMSYKEGPQLAYALPVMPGAFNLKILDGANPVTFTEKGGIFTIDAAQHQAGKNLLLSYELPDTAPRNFTLAHVPVQNSAAIQMAAGDCDLGTGFEIIGNKLSAICPVKTKTEFTLTYKYRELNTTFTMASIKDPEAGSWKVLIDGEATTDYTREGSTIKLSFEPLLDSKITIQYTFPE